MFKDRLLKNSIIIPQTATSVTSSISAIGESLPRNTIPNRQTQVSLIGAPKMFMPPGKIKRSVLIKSNQRVSSFVTPTTEARASFSGGVLQSAELEISEESPIPFNDTRIDSQITYQINGKKFRRRGMDFGLSSSRVVEEKSYSETEEGSIRFNFVVNSQNSKVSNKSISCDIDYGKTDVIVDFHKAIHENQSLSDKFEFFDVPNNILIDRQLNGPKQKSKEVTGEQIYFDDLRVTIRNNIQKDRITWDYVLGDEIYPSAGDPFSKRIPNSIAFRSF